MDFQIFITILVGTVLINNLVLQQFLGACPFLGVSKEKKGALGMSLAIIFVMLMATAATWPIYHFLLSPNGLGFLQTIVFILVIATLVQLVEIALKKFVPPLYKTLGIYLPLMTTNCAIFAVTIVNIRENYSYLTSLVNAFGSGFGFLIAMLLFSGIREYTENANPPKAFKGMPLTLISAAILSFAFYGFSGIVENIFR
ncbi:MAG: RnfABCDGE type electron transport complex subunit A [Treponema sp.]|nr:RnfABCDGE type electron transport complex subunit A [Treponema sp.]